MPVPSKRLSTSKAGLVFCKRWKAAGPGVLFVVLLDETIMGVDEAAALSEEALADWNRPRHNSANEYTIGGISRDAGLTDEQFKKLL